MSVRFDAALGPIARRLGAWGFVLVLTLMVSAGGCKKSNKVSGEIIPPEPEEIKQLTDQLKVKKSIGMIKDIRILSATRLGDAGPAAKDAIPALEKLAQDKDPDAKAAAEAALKKIKGQ